jgi:mRNA-degrading endonuclease RelE of RelBE toxin-antitoxin system
MLSTFAGEGELRSARNGALKLVEGRTVWRIGVGDFRVIFDVVTPRGAHHAEVAVIIV